MIRRSGSAPDSVLLPLFLGPQGTSGKPGPRGQRGPTVSLSQQTPAGAQMAVLAPEAHGEVLPRRGGTRNRFAFEFRVFLPRDLEERGDQGVQQERLDPRFVFYMTSLFLRKVVLVSKLFFFSCQGNSGNDGPPGPPGERVGTAALGPSLSLTDPDLPTGRTEH